LIEGLQALEQADLARAVVAWLRRSLLASRMPETDIPEIENLQEARTMLAERVEGRKEQWLEEGQKAGRKEGREEGESRIFLKLLARKFGAIDAETATSLGSR
jgi:flagellar biosynthesis/type III secretory pathway protein FliH